MQLESKDYVFERLEAAGYLELDDSDYNGAAELEKKVIEEIVLERRHLIVAEVKRALSRAENYIMNS